MAYGKIHSAARLVRRSDESSKSLISAVLTYYGGLANCQNSEGSRNDYVVKREQIGTLVVSLFDKDTKKLVWRGSSSNTLSDKSKRNIKNFDKGVQELFEHFPPKLNDLIGN